jgi:hypothetical protein
MKEQCHLKVTRHLTYFMIVFMKIQMAEVKLSSNTSIIKVTQMT